LARREPSSPGYGRCRESRDACSPPPIAASRAASAVSYCRVDWPIAAQTTTSKIWSSLKPASRTAAMSSSVTLYACLATLSTNLPTGPVIPASSKAARRMVDDASPPPCRTRDTRIFRACVMFDIAVLTFTCERQNPLRVGHERYWGMELVSPGLDARVLR